MPKDVDTSAREAAREAYSKEYKRLYQAGKAATPPERRWYPPTEGDLPMHGWSPYSAIHIERIRANAKHVDKPGGSMECKSFDSPDWLPVLVEEIGEVAKEICDYRHGLYTFEEYKSRIREELIQVAAMTTAWIDAIDLDYRNKDGKINGSN